MSYKHITSDQQNELSAPKRTKIKQKETAQILGKDRTTIYRELIRNKNKDGKYDARIAKQKTKRKPTKNHLRQDDFYNKFHLIQRRVSVAFTEIVCSAEFLLSELIEIYTASKDSMESFDLSFNSKQLAVY